MSRLLGLLLGVNEGTQGLYACAHLVDAERLGTVHEEMMMLVVKMKDVDLESLDKQSMLVVKLQAASVMGVAELLMLDVRRRTTTS